MTQLGAGDVAFLAPATVRAYGSRCGSSPNRARIIPSSSARKMFSLKLLGGAVAYGPQGPIGGRLAQRRRLALLAVLALAGRKPVSRDRLLALFWPEADAERARHSLADSVYQIRRELSEKAVVSVGEDLLLNAELIASDVAEFEGAIESGELQAAVEIYAGPLLDGFHVSDAPEFERWVDGE
ncbi:MAG TPA: hypothetical protein VK933_10350, partial [Longimicrobiales bacterium]|nr:hypothetical protein [Longimicrobiales bacterium]